MPAALQCRAARLSLGRSARREGSRPAAQQTAFHYCLSNCPAAIQSSDTCIYVSSKATKHAKGQTNKSHLLINVSRALFIGREPFPKRHFLVIF